MGPVTTLKRPRFCAALIRVAAVGMVEAGKQFRRVNGHLHLPALRDALEAEVTTETVGTSCQDETENAA